MKGSTTAMLLVFLMLAMVVLAIGIRSVYANNDSTISSDLTFNFDSHTVPTTAITTTIVDFEEVSTFNHETTISTTTEHQHQGDNCCKNNDDCTTSTTRTTTLPTTLTTTLHECGEGHAGEHNPHCTTLTTTEETTIATTTIPTTTIPASCSGTPSLTLVPNPVDVSSSVNAIVSGLSNCDGDTIYINDYLGCTSGTIIASFTGGATGGSVIFEGPSASGLYGYYACVNGESSTKAILTVSGVETTTTIETTTILTSTTTILEETTTTVETTTVPTTTIIETTTIPETTTTVETTTVPTTTIIETTTIPETTTTVESTSTTTIPETTTTVETTTVPTTTIIETTTILETTTTIEEISTITTTIPETTTTVETTTVPTTTQTTTIPETTATTTINPPLFGGEYSTSGGVVTTTVLPTITVGPVGPTSTVSLTNPLTNLNQTLDSFCGNYTISEITPALINFVNANAFFGVVTNSSTPTLVRVCITNSTSSTPGGGAGQNKLVALNISITPNTGVIVNSSIGYDCTISANEVSAYKLGVGVWSKIVGAITDENFCRVSFLTGGNETVGLLQQLAIINPNVTTTIQQQANGGGIPSWLWLLPILVLLVLLILLWKKRKKQAPTES